MRKLFVVGSSIQPRKGVFTYSPTRSTFDAEERFRQTIFTINSIHSAFPDSDIAVIDSSDDYKEYHFVLSKFLGVNYVPLKEISKEAFEIVNSHTNKSLCESLLLNVFFQEYRRQIKEYDYVIKTTGRYFHFNFDDKLFTKENTDKIFFKKPLHFPWNDSWNYSFVDVRQEQQTNELHQYCTVLYGFGAQHLDKFIDINEATIHLLKQPSMLHYDIETLSYYLTRQYKDIIIETDWKVSGWDGTSGRFMYY